MMNDDIIQIQHILYRTNERRVRGANAVLTCLGGVSVRGKKRKKLSHVNGMGTTDWNLLLSRVKANAVLTPYVLGREKKKNPRKRFVVSATHINTLLLPYYRLGTPTYT